MSEDTGAAPVGENSAPQQGGGAWFESLPPEDLGYLETKGWNKPGSEVEVLKSYRHAEKLIGTIKGSPDRVLVMPKDFESPEYAGEVAEFYSKLGRPESPDKYSWKPEGDLNDGVANWFRDRAYEMGLSDKAVSVLGDEFVQLASMVNEQQETQFTENSKAELDSWMRSKGNAADQFIQAGKVAVNQLGLSPEMVDGLERAWGTGSTMEFLANIGRMFGEDSSVGIGGSMPTPAGALSQLGELKADQAFMNAYLDASNPGHDAAVAKYSRLMKMAYPDY